MKNPNAVVATLTGAIATGIQYLLARYGHHELTKYYSDLLTGGLMGLVLLIGRDGVKGAIARGITLVKKIWSGFGPKIDPSPSTT